MTGKCERFDIDVPGIEVTTFPMDGRMKPENALKSVAEGMVRIAKEQGQNVSIVRTANAVLGLHKNYALKFTVLAEN